MEFEESNPTTREQLDANDEQYTELLKRRNAERSGSMGTNVLYPWEPSEMAAKAFHECMTEHGHLGVEYAQEALHGNGEYFDDYFDEVEEMREDLRRYKEIDEEVS